VAFVAPVGASGASPGVGSSVPFTPSEADAEAARAVVAELFAQALRKRAEPQVPTAPQPTSPGSMTQSPSGVRPKVEPM
jgi:hypothetical protein